MGLVVEVEVRDERCYRGHGKILKVGYKDNDKQYFFVIIITKYYYKYSLRINASMLLTHLHYQIA